MDLQITFSDPDMVSMLQEKDLLEIKILKGQYFRTIDGFALEDDTSVSKGIP